MPPAEIATEHAVQCCFVVYIHAFAAVELEELGELPGYVIITCETTVELFELALDAKTGGFPDFPL